MDGRKPIVTLIWEAEMNKLALLLTAVVLLLLAPGGSVHAQGYTPYRQGYGPYSRPLLSPYLNMLRGGDPATNYYLGVIPEIDRRTNYARVRSNILNIEQQLEDQTAPTSPAVTAPLKSTGHPVTFLNTSGYFPASPLRPGGLQQQMPGQPRPGTPTGTPRP
jgi:hypothetical protein